MIVCRQKTLLSFNQARSLESVPTWRRESKSAGLGEMTLSGNTVRYIMEKLGPRNRVQVITLALKKDHKRH